MAKKQVFSYMARQGKLRHARQIIVIVLAFVLIYLAINSLVLSNVHTESTAMQPGINAGDRILFLSHEVFDILDTVVEKPLPKRGEVILIDRSTTEPSLPRTILGAIVRLLTAQQIDITGNTKNLYIKRVVALPGDEIYMSNYTLRIRTKDSPYSLTEFELAGKPYNIIIPEDEGETWNSSLPFSGTMDRITVQEGECFVLSDDRSATNDSRTWGTIPLDSIKGNAIFRYWPVQRIGAP
ncbi:MAG: signal peptidase I [Spirochaetaceae bacterium]|jgi:signal peptidase I|nr:signal peptidase I [Spirochaetaceae bacterium]